MEGQTELVLGTHLQEHLGSRRVWLQPVIVKTRRAGSEPAHRGGVSKWSLLRREILALLRDTSAACVTTMYDFYRLPSDVPGMHDRERLPAGHRRVEYVEQAMTADINDERFLPYLALHETEALVLAAPAVVLDQVAPPGVANRLRGECAGREPELVNETAPPSHVLKESWPGYVKEVDGPLVVESAGLDEVRERCPHFDAWLTRLEALGSAG